MKELIEDWEKNADRREDESFDFLTRLKNHPNMSRVDRVARETHEQVFSEIDCTKCANCCKTKTPLVKKSDITKISAVLGISKKEFTEKYLSFNEDEGEYEINALPCPFLKENKCSIYEVRPANCRGYPYTDKKEFTTRRYMHTDNTIVCPAVYHIVERMKQEFNYRRRR